MLSFKCGYAAGLKSVVDSSGGRPLAFVLGTRKGDPNSKGQGAYAPSSSFMPAFMRVPSPASLPPLKRRHLPHTPWEKRNPPGSAQRGRLFGALNDFSRP